MRRWRALALLLLAVLAAATARAEDCKPSPLGTRELYLRGSMNGWGAPDAQRFRYVCNRYELVTRIAPGQHSFKVADEDWSPDADFGGPAARMALKGPAIEARLDGAVHRFVLRMSEPASLAISVATAGEILPPAPPAVVDDPVARSLRFDTRDPAHKLPFGAVTENTEVQFTLAALAGVGKATLVIEKRRLEGNQELLEYLPAARMPMVKTATGWSARHRFAGKAIYGYWFELEIAGKRYAYQNNRDEIHWTKERGSMGLGVVEALAESPRRIRRFRQTVYAADFKVPDWARDAVYYYVFPERFRNGDRRNDPQPGVAKYHATTVELHANWLDKPWKPNSGDGSDAHYNNDFFGGDLAGIIDKLDYIKELGANTIYMTPVFKAASNHKYDTADYHRIDPGLGTNADFERLCAEAARRGIRVIPDTSLNHVGQDSPYFNRFMNYPAGGAYDGGKVNPASPYAGWFSFDDKGQYKGWAGVADLPELNKASPAWRAFAYGDADSVTRSWLRRGAAGWRMDVAPWVPDDFWAEWRSAVKATRPDALTIAETWFDAAKFFLGDAFDSTMNYIFRNAVLDYAAGGDAGRLVANLELMRQSYPPQAFYALMNLLSTHDQARALHHFGYHDDGNASKLAAAKQRLLLAVLIQMTYPGAPSIYYGDEVGVAGGDDPYNRATYPWADLGGQPDTALLADFKRLVKLRNEHAVLRHGSIGAPLFVDAHTVVLARQDGRQWAVTAVNNAETERSISVRLPAALAGATLRDALGNTTQKVGADGTLQLTLPPLFGRILLWN